MAKEFDATTKYLLENHPRDLLALAGLPDAENYVVKAIDADLSTVTAAADKILRVSSPDPFLTHFEMQSGPDQTVEDRTLQYNVLSGYQHKLPVLSVLVLLRREANSPRLTGNLQKRLPDGTPYLNFAYRVVRLWEKPVEEILAGGLGVLPLAPLSDVAESALPDVIARMKMRIDAETTPQDAAELWVSTRVLMGLRYEKEFTDQMLEGVRNMKDSVTYQAILQEGRQEGEQIGRQEGEQIGRQEGEQIGRIEEARRMLVRIGTRRFGAAPDAILTGIDALTLEDLEALADRLHEVESWSELLPASE